MRLSNHHHLHGHPYEWSGIAAEPTGDWRVEDGSAIIRIDNCRGALWGVVAWEKDPGTRQTQRPPDAGQPRADQHAGVVAGALGRTNLQRDERPDL